MFRKIKEEIRRKKESKLCVSINMYRHVKKTLLKTLFICYCICNL